MHQSKSIYLLCRRICDDVRTVRTLFKCCLERGMQCSHQRAKCAIPANYMIPVHSQCPRAQIVNPSKTLPRLSASFHDIPKRASNSRCFGSGGFNLAMAKIEEHGRFRKFLCNFSRMSKSLMSQCMRRIVDAHCSKNLTKYGSKKLTPGTLFQQLERHCGNRPGQGHAAASHNTDGTRR